MIIRCTSGKKTEKKCLFFFCILRASAHNYRSTAVVGVRAVSTFVPFDRLQPSHLPARRGGRGTVSERSSSARWLPEPLTDPYWPLSTASIWLPR